MQITNNLDLVNEFVLKKSTKLHNSKKPLGILESSCSFEPGRV
jgi:hypothetical protein